MFYSHTVVALVDERWDMSVDNDTQEMLPTSQLSIAWARMSSMPCTMGMTQEERCTGRVGIQVRMEYGIST